MTSNAELTVATNFVPYNSRWTGFSWIVKTAQAQLELAGSNTDGRRHARQTGVDDTCQAPGTHCGTSQRAFNGICNTCGSGQVRDTANDGECAYCPSNEIRFPLGGTPDGTCQAPGTDCGTAQRAHNGVCTMNPVQRELYGTKFMKLMLLWVGHWSGRILTPAKA